MTEDGFKDAIKKYENVSAEDPIVKLLDDIQSHLECCGARNVSDWFGNVFNETHLPYSCCKHEGDHQICVTDKAFSNGKHNLSKFNYNKTNQMFNELSLHLKDVYRNWIKKSKDHLVYLEVSLLLLQLFS